VPAVAGGEARLEQCDAAPARAGALAAAAAGDAALPAVAAGLPRPRPRARDVHRRGLPPARAPTC
jgi:hypothetical protein